MMRKATVILFSLAFMAPVLIDDVSATPGKSSVCSSCHDTSSNVTVQAAFMGCSGSNASYGVSVSNTYSGQEGWAVFDAGANIQNAYGASGSFSVPSGRSYELWGVSKDPSSMNGSNYTVIRAECGTGSCTPTASAERRRLCFDGLDNDCDNLIDAADPDCSLENCSNGADDDGDGKVDCDDRKDCHKDPNCTPVH